MSSYIGKAINPKTGQVEEAWFLENYKHTNQYGIKFLDGEVYLEEDIQIIK